jgi:hypothetical protein
MSYKELSTGLIGSATVSWHVTTGRLRGSIPLLVPNLNLKLMGKYIIHDWMGNHIFRNYTFTTFEAGWDFIYENIKLEYEDNHTYDDFYVVEI